MYMISCPTRSLVLMKRNSQLHQNVCRFCDVKKKSHIGHISLATKNYRFFDLRSLEVKGLHQLPAKQAPKCSACMKLEHNKCFL